MSTLEMAHRFNNYHSIIQDDEKLVGLCDGKEPPKCSLTTGIAGTGKSWNAKEETAKDPKKNLLAATTGIAAVNLGNEAKTIHSTLKFFNDESIKRNYNFGGIQTQLEKLYENGTRRIRIDEVSMMSANIGNHIVEAIADFNHFLGDDEERLELELIGDFCQLPPVEGDYLFKGNCWKFFEPNITRLSKIWRQENPEFIQALNLLREGNGREAAYLLQKCGVQYKARQNPNFDGTTLISKNIRVDAFNADRLKEVNNPLIRSLAIRKGEQPKEWNSYVPNILEVKVGAYVMILANKLPDFSYVNGDCGTVIEYDSFDDSFIVELVRNRSRVRIKKITRENCSNKKELSSDELNAPFKPYLNLDGKWVVGTITYHPLRLAWASSVHKSQGLSLDKVQIDIKDWFFGHPSMAYVAVSRARTPENLVIIGSPSELAAKTKIAPEVRRWI